MAFLGAEGEAQGFIIELINAGVVPQETRRVLIDIPYDDVCKVYYDCYANKRMCSAKFAKLLKDSTAVVLDANKVD